MAENTKTTADAPRKSRGKTIAVILTDAEYEAMRDIRHTLRFDKLSDCLRAAVSEFVANHTAA